MGYGGNPYGPAGTGKTESVKALAVALGRPVLVFNCDGEFDVAAMGRIFQGLVQCGAWGCFDEFNRLSEGVLSAVSQHIQVIQVRLHLWGLVPPRVAYVTPTAHQLALRGRAPSMELMGRSVQVHPDAAIFVTLNPAGHAPAVTTT